MSDTENILINPEIDCDNLIGDGKRRSFAAVEEKRHPLAENYTNDIIIRDRSLIRELDSILVDDIIKVYKEIRTQANGEWKWIQENKQGEYLELLNKGDSNLLVLMFRNFFRNCISYGIISCDFDDLVKDKNIMIDYVNSILLDFDTWLEFCDYKSHIDLINSNCGNPYGIDINGRVILKDSCRHYYHALKISELINDMCLDRKPTILEIGGGYGGMYLYLRKMNNACYINCDIAETLLIFYYYVSTCVFEETGKLPKIKWCLDGNISYNDICENEIILIPAKNKETIKNTQIDIVYNCNSLSEMSKQEVDSYFEIINQIEPQYIFHQNSNYCPWAVSSRDHVENLAENFPINTQKYRKVYMAMSPWIAAQGRYREFLYSLRA